MKNTKKFMVIVGCLAALSIVGCSRKEETSEKKEEIVEEEQSVEETTPVPEEEIETTPVEEEQKKAVQVKYEHLYTDQSEEYGIITGVDENEETIWQFETAKNPAAQLDAVQEIGTREDTYYFESSEGIFAVRISDGSVVWKNTDGRGDHYCFDADGNLYLCGMLGPHFLAIDVNGNTLCKIDKLDESHYWPYDLQWEGEKVTMKFDGVPEGEKPGVVCEINLNDYSYQFLNGTSGMNQADINGAGADTVTGEPVAEATDYNQLWTNFIKEKGYASYVGEWPVPVRDYCILDIDQNGIPEMVLCSDAVGGGFVQCQLYSVNNGNIVMAAEFTTCYGFVYSPKYHALAYSDSRGSLGSSDTQYMQFDGSQFYKYMDLCEDVDMSTGNIIYTQNINGQSREIPEGEYRRILSESVQNPEFILVN